jgi:hypothetical protein
LEVAALFNSDAAVAALLSRNNIRDWAELNPQQTGVLLQQTERDKQAANLALAGEALQQVGATDRAQREIDYYKWANKESQKGERRRSSLALLGSLQGVGTAGRRLGISPAQMASVDPNAMLQNLNSLVSGLGTLGNPSPDYARYLSQAYQYVPGMARSS